MPHVWHKKAVATLRARNKLVDEATVDIEEAQRKNLEKRAAAVLALKQSTEAAQARCLPPAHTSTAPVTSTSP